MTTEPWLFVACRVDVDTGGGWMSEGAGQQASTSRLIRVKALGRMAILCLVCMRLSHNPTDVANRSCGNCHRFHDDARPSEATP